MRVRSSSASSGRRASTSASTCPPVRGAAARRRIDVGLIPSIEYLARRVAIGSCPTSRSRRAARWRRSRSSRRGRWRRPIDRDGHQLADIGGAGARPVRARALRIDPELDRARTRADLDGDARPSCDAALVHRRQRALLLIGNGRHRRSTVTTDGRLDREDRPGRGLDVDDRPAVRLGVLGRPDGALTRRRCLRRCGGAGRGRQRIARSSRRVLPGATRAPAHRGPIPAG